MKDEGGFYEKSVSKEISLILKINYIVHKRMTWLIVHDRQTNEAVKVAMHDSDERKKMNRVRGQLPN